MGLRELLPHLAAVRAAQPSHNGAVQTQPLCLVAAAGGTPLRHVLLQHAAASQHASGWDYNEIPQHYLLVGPEGDWTPGELSELVQHGAALVGLGSLRLRTETAGVALLATASQVLC